MKISLQTLQNQLRSNVCEIMFVRRRARIERPAIRRMLCTLDDTILTSINGKMTLNYRQPTHMLPYNAQAKNLLPVWDIFMQDWRMVNMDDCQIVQTIKNIDFWKYFN